MTVENRKFIEEQKRKNFQFAKNEKVMELVMNPTYTKRDQKIKDRKILSLVNKRFSNERMELPTISSTNLNRVVRLFNDDYIAEKSMEAVLDRLIVTEQSKLLDARQLVNTKTTDKMFIEAYEKNGYSVAIIPEGGTKPTTSNTVAKSISRIGKAGVGFSFTEEMFKRAGTNMLLENIVDMGSAFQQFEEKFIVASVVNGVVDGRNNRKGYKHDSLVMDFSTYTDTTALNYNKLVDMGQVASRENFLPTNLLLNQKTLSSLMLGDKEVSYNANWKYSQSDSMRLVVPNEEGAPIFPRLLAINKMGVTDFVPDGQVVTYNPDFYTYYINQEPRSRIDPFRGATDSQDINFNMYFGGFYSNRNHAIKGINASYNSIPDSRFVLG